MFRLFEKVLNPTYQPARAEPTQEMSEERCHGGIIASRAEKATGTRGGGFGS